MKALVQASVAAFGVLLGLAACRGPEPAVRSYELLPAGSEGAPHLVVVLIENEGRGEGQIGVTARLRSRAIGRTAAEVTEAVDLSPHEFLQVVIELRPVSPGPYEVVVEAKYPP